MKTITFSSGKTLKISQEIANKIKDGILGGKCPKFKIFSNEDGVYLLVNVDEIFCIE